jgi:hypothetical protein
MAADSLSQGAGSGAGTQLAGVSRRGFLAVSVSTAAASFVAEARMRESRAQLFLRTPPSTRPMDLALRINGEDCRKRRQRGAPQNLRSDWRGQPRGTGGICAAWQQAGRTARYVNTNFADYLVPVNADIRQVEVIFVPEVDELVNPLGIEGLGELGNVGTAAAIANAVYHATGQRVRKLPIRIENMIG